MEVNFAENITNVDIKFDTNNNYKAMGNSSFWIHGNKWNGSVEFPYGATKVSVNNSRVLNKAVKIPNTVTDVSFMFHNASIYNLPTNFPDSVTNMQATFRDAVNYNATTKLSNNASDCMDIFANCYNYNTPTAIPDSVTNCQGFFFQCNRFNQGVTIPNNVTMAYRMFDNCSNFNNTVTIGSKVANLVSMFSNCRIFNRPVTLPSVANNVAFMFNSCVAFNSPVSLPASVTNCAYMFNYANAFNQAVSFPSGIKNTYFALHYANSFNNTITIPNSSSASLQNLGFMNNFNRAVTVPSYPALSYVFGGINMTKYGNVMSFYSNRNLYGNMGLTSSFNGWIRPMTSDAWYIISQNSSYNLKTNVYLNYVNFYGARSYFNRPVTIEAGVYYINRLFYGCTAYNQPTTIPYTVRNCVSMFEDASYFNSYVTMGSNITDCGWMFKNAIRYNQSTTIPTNATSCWEMFYNCTNFNRSVTIPSKVTNCGHMFYNSAFSQTITIPNSVTNCYEMFAYSQFRSAFVLPNYANTYRMLHGTNFAQQIFIPSVNTGVTLQNLGTFPGALLTTIPSTHNPMSYLFGGIQYGSLYIEDPNINIYTNLGISTGHTQVQIIPQTEAVFNNLIRYNSYWNQNTFINYWNFNCRNNAYPYWSAGIVLQSNVYIYENYFANCGAFNGQVVLGGTGTSAANMFLNCTSLNYMAEEGTRTITNCRQMYYGCTRLNKPISIPYYAEDCRRMFQRCTSLNPAYIQIEGPHKYCDVMFAQCTSLNPSWISIENGVTSMANMFSGCSALSNEVTIPNSATTCEGMFNGCNQLRTVYVRNVVDYQQFLAAFRSNNSVQLTIYTDEASRANLCKTNMVIYNVDEWTSRRPTWRNQSSGSIGWSYNALYNIYIYNNYTY